MTKKNVLSLIASILIASIILILCTLTLTHNPSFPTMTLDDDWDVTINNNNYDNVRLSEFYKIFDGELAMGDHIVMSKFLPDLGFFPNPTITFRTRYTTLTCYLDGKKIYDFGSELYQQNRFLGKLYHIITLDSDYANRVLVMEMYVTETNPFSVLEPPIIGTHNDLSGLLVHSNLMIIATGVFLFLFGVAFLGIALLFVISVPEVKSLLFGAVYSINIGVWLLAYYNTLSFFIYTPYETEIEYFTMYLIVPQSILLIYYIFELKGDRVFLAIMSILCAVPVLQFILHFVFNVHLRVTLPLYHMDGLFGFGVLIYYTITHSKKEKENSAAQLQMFGLLAFCISLFVHFIVYYIGYFHIPMIPFLDKLSITLGCLMFVMCQLSTYMVFITDNYAKKQENISLSHLAYADGLTNLPNRAKVDKYMAELDNSEKDYCMISIDLNGLKQVNDKFGHPTGDKYIKDFAKVLTNTFGEVGFCARVGGDEFLVVLEDSEVHDVNGLIGRMNSALNVMNALYTEYRRSVASGYACRHEFYNPNAHKVYMRADQRMYEEKKRMHEELGIHTRL